jgi:chitin synthase
LPTRINIANLYAFCNIHDVSWGTKGSPERLPSVTSFGRVNVEIPDYDDTDEVDKMYLDAAQLLKTKAPDVSLSSWNSEADWGLYYQRFRTLVMGSWALSNILLVFIVLHLFGPSVSLLRSITFASYVLWWFVSLTGLKCIGAICYFFTQRRQEWMKKNDKMKEKKTR